MYQLFTLLLTWLLMKYVNSEILFPMTYSQEATACMVRRNCKKVVQDCKTAKLQNFFLVTRY
jgi:hypothetical protein